MLPIIPIPAFKDNYIWLLLNTIKRSCAVVDPGDAKPVLNYLVTENYTLSAILLTHHHADHCGGVPDLVREFKVPVYGPANEAITTITHPLQSTDLVELPELNINFKVLTIPGHTKGHIAYYGNGVLFSGDTLFLAGCGRLFEGTAAQMYQSLTTLAALPENYLVYCGHEYTKANLLFARAVEPSNLAISERLQKVEALRQINEPTVPASLQLEKLTNPFLRCHLPSVQQAAEQWSSKVLDTADQVFQVIRQWKDGFIA